MNLTRIPRPALIAGLSSFAVLVVLVAVGISVGFGHSHRGSRAEIATRQRVSKGRPPSRHVPHKTGASAHSRGPAANHARRSHATQSTQSAPRASPAHATTSAISLPKEIGQLIISTYAGTAPPARMLDAVRAGRTGAVILMGDNTAAGLAQTRAAVDSLQAAARAGGNPELLIMTDQEGGEVKRLAGAPEAAAMQMSNPSVAYRQGVRTGVLLRRAGVNLDLAPVADVSRTDGFMTQEERTFGAQPRTVARGVCAFARGLERAGVGYTLKHFPGLGDATESTDGEPVSISESAADIYADDLAYRACARGPDAAVMVSSASYPHLTGSTPAVLSPRIYHHVMPRDHIHALTLSDSFESGAIERIASPAATAINAGLDMVMYPGTESASTQAYAALLADARRGALDRSRVEAAADEVLAYKHALGLASR